jgi:hypothetical protein
VQKLFNKEVQMNFFPDAKIAFMGNYDAEMRLLIIRGIINIFINLKASLSCSFYFLGVFKFIKVINEGK